MHKSIKIVFSIFLIFTTIAILSFKKNGSKVDRYRSTAQPKIQAAILLDVSGSMDGLIEQAKAQLWNMVTTMGKAKCNTGIDPTIEIALYEYGRTNNDAAKGYVKQLSGFTNDLDSLTHIEHLKL